MTKYAHQDNTGRWIDIRTVLSETFPDLETLVIRTEVGGYEAVDDGVENVTLDNVGGTYANPTPVQVIDAISRVLSKTAFQDYAVSQLGGDVTGTGRVTDIMDATRDRATSAMRFAFARYEAAQTFEKANTAALTALMVSAPCMTSDERTATLDT